MKSRFLMCAPQHFEVAYVINPWMEGNIARGSNPVAMQQWSALLALLRRHAQVDCISAREGVPDLVFTANAGLVLENRVLLSNFRHAERQPEEAYFAQWFAEHGFEVLTLPPEVYFEGAGDALQAQRLTDMGAEVSMQFVRLRFGQRLGLDQRVRSPAPRDESTDAGRHE